MHHFRAYSRQQIHSEATPQNLEDVSLKSELHGSNTTKKRQPPSIMAKGKYFPSDFFPQQVRHSAQTLEYS